MTDSELPSVAAVIPTHNRRAGLPALIDAVASEPLAEIVVIVNGGGDGSLGWLRERAATEPRLRAQSAGEPSQTLALQTGVELATSDVVILLDDDVLPEPGWARGHARHHAGAEGLVVIGYMPVERPRRRRRGQFPLYIYADDYERACEGYERDRDSILRGLWGGNVSMRRADCLRVGLRPGPGMPAGYGYHEDRDLGLRCEAAGLRGAFDRGLRARHLYDKSPAAFLRAARNSGATRAAVQAAHAEALGPLPADFFARGAPWPGRLLVRWARREGARRPTVALLRGLAAFAGTLRLFRIETHLGFLIGAIEQQRGAIEQRQSAVAPHSERKAKR